MQRLYIVLHGIFSVIHLARSGAHIDLSKSEAGAFSMSQSLLQHSQYTCGAELSSLPTNQMWDISAMQFGFMKNISIQFSNLVLYCD